MPVFSKTLVAVDWPGGISMWTGIDYGRRPAETIRVGNDLKRPPMRPLLKIDRRLAPQRCNQVRTCTTSRK